MFSVGIGCDLEDPIGPQPVAVFYPYLTISGAILNSLSVNAPPLDNAMGKAYVPFLF
jgi:hypothetical protein